MYYNTTIQKWGNSQAVRLPKAILESVSLEENDKVEITADSEVITIKKAPRRRRAKKSLETRLEEFYQKPIEDILADDNLYTPVEVDWGKPVGKEVW